ncbi:MAG TPA: TolC family protein [Pricia sp.]|nr:TolC family protein [Pricia sp.]
MIGTRTVAQETWTLEECVAYAVANNLVVNDVEYYEDASREAYRQSVRNLLPSVSGFSNYDKRFGRSEDPNTSAIVTTDFFSNNYALNSSIDLFRGFQKWNAIKAAKFIREAAHEEVLQEKYLLAFRVMSAFYSIRFNEGLVDISKEQEQISQNNYDLVKRQIELGLKAGADLYEAESQLFSDKLKVTQAQNSLADAQLTLIQEMNLTRVKSIELQTSLDDITVASDTSLTDRDSIYGIAENFIPTIKARELRAKAAKKQVRVARGALFPSLTMNAGYATGYFETNVNDAGDIIPFRDQFRDNTSRYFGFSLNVPISDQWSRRSKIKQQKIERLRAENNLNLERQQLYQQIQQLVQNHESFAVEYAQSTKKVISQRAAFTIAQKKYERGLINSLDLSLAQNLFATAQNENLDVRLRLIVNEKTLDFYRGLPVFDIE